MRKKLGGVVSLTLAMTIVFSYQNCSPVHEGNFAEWNEQASKGLPPFPAELATALSTSCSSCHAQQVSSPEAFVTAISLDAGPWVNLDDPENSLVLKSVLKEAPAPAQGMPQGTMDPWESADLLRSWLTSLGDSDSGMEPPTNLGPATFSSVHAVMQTYCISCHSSGGSASQFPLTTYQEVMNYVDTSGGTSLGEIYQNVASGSMPKNPVTMSDSIRDPFLDLLFDWITAGAPNN